MQFSFDFPDTLSPSDKLLHHGTSLFETSEKLSDCYFEWANAFNLYTEQEVAQLSRDNYPLLITSCYLEESFNQRLLLVKFLFYFFIHDNVVDSNQYDMTHINDYHKQLLTNKMFETKEAWSQSLMLIQRELTSLENTHYNFDAFRASTIDYFDNTTMLYVQRQTKQAIEEESLITQRLNTGGVEQMFEFGLALRNIQLTASERQNPNLRMLIDSANKVIVLCNDIASLQVEARFQTQKQAMQSNLVLYKIHACNHTETQAISYVNERIHTTLCKMDSIIKHTPLSPSQMKYVSLMRDWIHGNIHWSQITKRYKIPKKEQSE